MTFWSNPEIFAEPLKQNRWLLRITSLDGETIISVDAVKECSKPSFKIGTTEHKLLNNTYKYPTTVKWNPVTIKFLNINDGSAFASQTLKLTTKYIKASEFNAISNISKSEIKFNAEIQQINEEGEVIETWKLYNAFFSSIENGNLSYASDDFVEITAEIQYDWAENTFEKTKKPILGNYITKEVDLIKINEEKRKEDDLTPDEEKETARPTKPIPEIKNLNSNTSTIADLSTEEFKKLTDKAKPVAYGVIGANLQNRINDEKTGKEVSRNVEKITISNREASAQEQAQKTIIQVTKKEDNTELPSPPRPNDSLIDDTTQASSAEPFDTKLPPDESPAEKAYQKLVDPNQTTTDKFLDIVPLTDEEGKPVKLQNSNIQDVAASPRQRNDNPVPYEDERRYRETLASDNKQVVDAGEKEFLRQQEAAREEYTRQELARDNSKDAKQASVSEYEKDREEESGH